MKLSIIVWAVCPLRVIIPLLKLIENPYVGFDCHSCTILITVTLPFYLCHIIGTALCESFHCEYLFVMSLTFFWIITYFSRTINMSIIANAGWEHQFYNFVRVFYIALFSPAYFLIQTISRYSKAWFELASCRAGNAIDIYIDWNCL